VSLWGREGNNIRNSQDVVFMAEKKVWPSMTSVHVGLASWLPVSAIEASGPNLWDQAGAGWAGTLGGNGDAFI